MRGRAPMLTTTATNVLGWASTPLPEVGTYLGDQANMWTPPTDVFTLATKTGGWKTVCGVIRHALSTVAGQDKIDVTLPAPDNGGPTKFVPTAQILASEAVTALRSLVLYIDLADCVAGSGAVGGTFSFYVYHTISTAATISISVRCDY